MSSRKTAKPHNAVPVAKFSNPHVTAKGEPRAVVPFGGLATLWINTGTLCNIACANCYIESSPKNDALVYMTRREVKIFLDEAKSLPVAPLFRSSSPKIYFYPASDRFYGKARRR